MDCAAKPGLSRQGSAAAARGVRPCPGLRRPPLRASVPPAGRSSCPGCARCHVPSCACAGRCRRCRNRPRWREGRARQRSGPCRLLPNGQGSGFVFCVGSAVSPSFLRPSPKLRTRSANHGRRWSEHAGVDEITRLRGKLGRMRSPCQHPRMNHDDLNAAFARRLLAEIDALARVQRPEPVPHPAPRVLDGDEGDAVEAPPGPCIDVDRLKD